MTLLDKFMIALGFQVDDTGLQKFENRAQSVRESAIGLADVVGGVLTSAFVELFKSFVDTSAEFEKYAAVLGVLYQSVDEGKEAMNWISDFAVTSHFQLADLTQAFIRLKAFGLDPTKGALKTVGDTAAAFGRPLMDAVFAMDDAIEGINRPLRTFGISVKEAGNMVTYSFIQNGKQISKSVDKTNKVMVANTLMAIWNQRYGGAMEKLSHTWIGLWANLMDNVTRFKQKVMNAGPFEDVKAVLIKIYDIVDKATHDGTVDKFATLFDVGFKMIVESAQAFWFVLDKIITHTVGWRIALSALAFVIAGVIVSSITQTIGLMWKLIGTVLTFDASMVAIFALAAVLVLVIDDLYNYYKGNESVIGQLQKKFPLAVEAAYAAILLIIGGFVALKWSAISSMVETTAIVVMYAAEWVGTAIGVVAGFGSMMVAAGAWLIEMGAMAIGTLAGLASMAVEAILTGAAFVASFGSAAIAVLAATWPILAVIAALALVGFAVYEVWKHWDVVTKNMRKAWTFVVDEIKAGINWIINKMLFLGDKAYSFIKALPGGSRLLDMTAKLVPGAQPGQTSAASTLGNSVNASGGVIGRAGSNVTTNQSQAMVTHITETHAPITVISSDPDKAGKSVKKVLSQKSRQMVRNGQSAVAY